MAMDSMSKHVRAMLAFQKAGAEVFDYGNNIRQQAYNNGVTMRLNFPASCPPIFVRCFARARDRSAGWRFRATRRTFTPPIKPSWSCSPRMRICIAG
jgi:urocanate hydratase